MRHSATRWSAAAWTWAYLLLLHGGRAQAELVTISGIKDTLQCSTDGVIKKCDTCSGCSDVSILFLAGGHNVVRSGQPLDGSNRGETAVYIKQPMLDAHLIDAVTFEYRYLTGFSPPAGSPGVVFELLIADKTGARSVTLYKSGGLSDYSYDKGHDLKDYSPPVHVNQACAECSSISSWGDHYLVLRFHNNARNMQLLLPMAITIEKSATWGVVLLLVLGVSATAYVALGVVYSKVARGGSGRIHPHVDKWRSVLGLVLDGANFLLQSAGLREYEFSAVRYESIVEPGGRRSGKNKAKSSKEGKEEGDKEKKKKKKGDKKDKRGDTKSKSKSSDKKKSPKSKSKRKSKAQNQSGSEAPDLPVEDAPKAGAPEQAADSEKRKFKPVAYDPRHMMAPKVSLSRGARETGVKVEF